MPLKMDESVGGDIKSIKMGASSAPNSSRIALLQERKKGIEDKLVVCNKELRKLCIEEAELIGALPVEFPLEPGETPPVFRRRIGTSYELNKNLINNVNNEEEISALELEMQILSKKAEAARDLATINNGNKTMRRSLMMEYQQHKQKFNALEEKLHDLRMSLSNRQASSSSLHNGNHNQVQQQQVPAKNKKKSRPELEDCLSLNLNEQAGRHSRHSLRSYQYPVPENVELRNPRYTNYKVPENYDPQLRHLSGCVEEQHLVNSFHRVSLTGFKDYEERVDTQFSSHPVNVCRTLPHARKSPQIHDMPAKSAMYSPGVIRHATSPSTSSGSNSVKYFPLAPHMYQMNRTLNNPHQLQPHQQYEQNVMTSGGSGLGGFWKQSESGDIWCANTELSAKDKRFGSLDRRKNKRLQKRASPVADPKSATLGPSVVPHYPLEATRTLPIKSQTIASRHHRHDHRQLVRTQSLGSVGGITLDRSDDSSCSDNFNANDSSQGRKNKPKEWYETSLDGPPIPYYSPPPPRVQSIAPPPITPEEKYANFSTCPPPSLPSKSYAQQPTSPKEIPAESNPTSPKIPGTNLEIFNNNIPKNCTIVQQAQWKPYREETKPFEMADFYKYSTKYKKSVGKTDAPLAPQSTTRSRVGSPNKNQSPGFRNLPMSPPPSSSQSSGSNRNSDVSNSLSYNNSIFEVNPMSPHLAEDFSLEMNAWYQKHEHQKDNNNATLV